MTPLDEPPVRPTQTARWVVPVLVPLAAVCAAHLLIASADLGTLARSIAIGTAWGAALIAGMVVIALPALGSREGRRGVAVVASFILLTALASRLPPLPLFGPLERPWQGKIIDLIWVSLLFAVLWRWARTEAGLRWRLEPGSTRPALITIVGVLALFAALAAVSVALQPGTLTPVSAEEWAYDGTIPNLTEELIWRGAMLAVLDHALGTPRTVLGAPVGWGIVITSVVFGLGHGILVDPSGVWSLDLAGGLFAVVMGLAYGWIRNRTGSIWPAFLLHCAPELGLDLGLLITS
ncbi:CPBP family intramembrane glutamic endopeptidase [Nonomuraea sp. NPDC048826]|uniref:CPBP family intramembrane glutamic endopeptidase n=1 Tax=Nonomuraea sp. NPDC048826 TaxID=3364347 RepID=UPI00372453CF